MIEKAFKQFKLTNDDEIICEVIEWNNEDNDAMIVRGCMRVLNVEDFEKGIRFYAFRPWMVFMDDPEELHTINAAHIIGEVNPSNDILKHYFKCLKEIETQSKIMKRKKKHMSLDEVAEKTADMDEEEFEMYMHQLSELADEDDSSEVSGANIIRFKPKGTFH